MKPFLEKVAEAYATNDATDIVNYCFVFPNRRSSTFFRKYLTDKCGDNVIISPKITTISDFINEQITLCEPGRITLLLRLYQTYRNVCRQHGKEPVEFDRFLFWGDMMIGDFNDIDRYLVDADELFANVKNINDLHTDYLTEEQRYVIKQYWGVDRLPQAEDSLFVQSSYFSLWNSMAEMYHRFRDDLTASGLSYSGMSYRLAYEKISDMTADDFDFSRIIFVGFSTLSNSELKIFRKFKNLSIGDFYWDFESPFFGGDNKASYFLSQYIAEFPSRYDIIDHENDGHRPDINIIAVPSGAGQAQAVGQVLEQLCQKGLCNAANATDTAIVLPEEKYLNAVLGSVPDAFEKLNITMGLSVRQSPIASLLNSITSAERRKRQIDGESAYFYEDVEMLASHPYVRLLGGTDIERLINKIKRDGMFFVPSRMLSEEYKMFAQALNVNDGNSGEYLNVLFNKIYKKLADDETREMDCYFIGLYLQSLAQIESELQAERIEIKAEAMFYLLSRSMSGAIIPFEGRPLQGLQIMGVLETRLLDFKNLIVLSMNEKVFPTKHYTRSFISNSLRSAYGLSTTHHQDSMYAYYFYRMISRADNVYLLYDSRIKGLSSGEESRYITQLDRIYNKGLNHHRYYEYGISVASGDTITIQKNERIMSMLNKYREENSGKYLSASCIDKYITCPLKFYLSKVEGIPEDNEISDFIDSAKFGSVIHRVMELIYEPMVGRIVIADYLDSLLLPEVNPKYQKYITSAINEIYKNYPESRQDEKLKGESLLISKIVEYYVQEVIMHDKRLCQQEMKYIGSEQELKFHWDMGEGVKINFKGFIDRIDSIAGRMRIVDYKTGSDECTLANVDDYSDLFVTDDKTGKSKHAILQLLIYCNAYCKLNNVDIDITPVLYKLRDTSTCRSGQFKIKKSQGQGRDSIVISNFKTDLDNDALMCRLRDLMREIFNPEVPLSQTKNPKSCEFCQFNKLCTREKEN